jgi:hypothetical protein
MRIVSIGEREIFPFMKWERILDLIVVSWFMPDPSLAASGVNTTPHGAMLASILLLGI